MWTQAGACPHCGAPIYVPTAWWSIDPPPLRRTCGCIRPMHTVTYTNHTTAAGTPLPTQQPVNSEMVE